MKQTKSVAIGHVLTVLGRREMSFAIVTAVIFRVRRRAVKGMAESWPRSLARAAGFGLLASVNRYLRRKLILSGLPAARNDKQPSA